MKSQHIKSPKFTQLRHGLTEYVLLTVINSEDMYFNAEGIRNHLENTEFTIPKGTLYTTLLKMRKEKTVGYDSSESDIGPPRKYYFVTEKGKKLLSDLNQYWKTLNNTLESLKKSPRP